jgi:predicted amidohydrolase
MKARLAVVQFRTRVHDPAANLGRLETFLRRARARGADIVVFPEDFITGPVRQRTDLIDQAGEYLRTFRTLAARYRIDVVAGSIIERVGRKRAQNACYYIDARGRVLGRYAKVNLWLSERPYLVPGSAPEVVRTRFGRVGLTICWDLAFPELYRTYARQGAEILCNVAWWSLQDAGPGLRLAPDSEKLFINACCAARAFEEEAVVVFANAAERWTLGGKRYRSAGQSQVTVPFRGALARIDDDREGMIVQDVDSRVLTLAAQAYEIRKDLASGRRLT